MDGVQIMETGHLNVFHSYQNKPLNHEDQLTRAFLILVRSSKLVEDLFLDLIITRMRDKGISNLPPSLKEDSGGINVIETQIHSETVAKLEEESGRLISVIITDDELNSQYKVASSNRQGVYDGFIKYDPDWIFVIENKPDHRNIWQEQLSSAFNESYEIEPTPIDLVWPDIIKRLTLLHDNGFLHAAETILVEDFFTYVNEHFPTLNPYDRFDLCNGIQTLLQRRCLQIMEESKLGSVVSHKGRHDSMHLQSKPGIKEIALFPQSTVEGWKIILDLYPGDIMTQARKLYQTVSYKKVKSLSEKGWKIATNLHLSVISSGEYWMKFKPDLKHYIDYWKTQVKANNLKQIHREEWDKVFDNWIAENLMDENDRKNIQTDIAQKEYQTFNVCPGLNFRYQWTSDEAIEIDNTSESEFSRILKAKIQEALSVW